MLASEQPFTGAQAEFRLANFLRQLDPFTDSRCCCYGDPTELNYVATNDTVLGLTPLAEPSTDVDTNSYPKTSTDTMTTHKNTHAETPGGSGVKRVRSQAMRQVTQEVTNRLAVIASGGAAYAETL